MSRKPDTLPVAPEGFFRLTEWRPVEDGRSRTLRARWRASLAVLGVRTVEVEGLAMARGRSAVLVALWREGEEAVTREAAKKRRQRMGTKQAA